MSAPGPGSNVCPLTQQTLIIVLCASIGKKTTKLIRWGVSPKYRATTCIYNVKVCLVILRYYETITAVVWLYGCNHAQNIVRPNAAIYVVI